jgi:abequosyltransferase
MTRAPASDGLLLTIAIPTYNRAAFLEQLLESLQPQVRGEQRVEVIVSDNASLDNTGQVVQKFQRDGMLIRYLCNAENLGADGNILQCYEQAEGRYVWVVGDDDLIAPDGLAEIIRHLSEDEYDLVYITSSGFTSVSSLRAHPKVKYKVYEAVEEFVRHVHVFLTFISGNIVNKRRAELLKTRDFRELLGTSLVQLSWIFTALEGGGRTLCILDPLVGARTDNTGGYALYKVFGPNLRAIVDSWLSSDRLRKLIIHGTIQTFFPVFLLSGKKNAGKFLSEDAHEILRPVFGADVRYWIFDFPIIQMPWPLARLWFLIIRVINKVDRLLGNPLLGL